MELLLLFIWGVSVSYFTIKFINIVKKELSVDKLPFKVKFICWFAALATPPAVVSVIAGLVNLFIWLL